MATTAQAPPEVAATRTYECPQCSHELRVYGRDRHRIYFELGNELLDDPVMSRQCPVCERPLPGKTGASRS